MPITFGSVGDIIAICLLVKDLVSALDSSRGSASEYQEVIRSLQSLEQALHQVSNLSSIFANCPEMTALLIVAAQTVENCRITVDGFRDKIRKFEKSLGEKGSGGIARKVQWHVSRREEVARFESEVVGHCLAINMLASSAQMNLLQINNKKLNDRLDENRVKADDAERENTKAFVELRELAEENIRLQAIGNETSDRVVSALRLEWLRNMGGDLLSLMQKTYAMNVDIYRAVKSNEQTLASHLERSLIQEPFILEDALGRRHPVHLQWTISWEAFDFVLQEHFKNVQGYKKVRNREYVFQDHTTQRDIGRDKPWTMAFLPGLIVDMSLVFVDQRGGESRSHPSCPLCKSVLGWHEAKSHLVKCPRCAAWYHKRFQDPLPRSSFDTTVYPATNLDNTPLITDPTNPSEDSEDDAAHFRRVRFVETFMSSSDRWVRYQRRSMNAFKDAASLQRHVKGAHTRLFICNFEWEGCKSTFASKNEWKRHVASQHLGLNSWVREEGSWGSHQRTSSSSHNYTNSANGAGGGNGGSDKGSEFNRKDLFTQHLRLCQRRRTPLPASFAWIARYFMTLSSCFAMP